MNTAKQIWNFIRENAIIVILLVLYILFYHFWEDLIGNHLIDKFLQHCESSYLVDSIWCIAVLFCVIISCWNKGKRIKKSTLLICLIVLLLWVYYRFINNHLWNPETSVLYLYFTPLKIFNSIKYVDIVPICCICNLVSPLFKKDEPSLFNDDIGLIMDNPIDDIDDDIFGRGQQAEEVTNLLLKTNTNKGSFTVGINAPWGAGKTSYINLMKKHILSKSSECIILDFNPWIYAEKNDLVSAFFEELSKILKPFDNSLAKNIIDYSELLSAFNTKETKIIASLIDLTKNDISIKGKKGQIADAIKQIRRKIFVFIDDLDRLDADELMEIMKLIRNVSDFPYMYFIAAYDKEYLVECLEKRMKTKEIDFTEKIFQVEFQPLGGAKIDLSVELYRLLYQQIDKDDKMEFNRFFDWSRESDLFANMLSNIREVKRLANSFLVSYEYLKERTNVFDLLLLELFKTKHPLVYSYFADKRTSFVKERDSIALLKKTMSIANEKDKKGIKEYLSEKELRLTDSDITNIVNLLNILFNDDSFSESGKNIRDPRFFENYFAIDSSDSEIARSKFDDLLQSNNIESIKSMFLKWSAYKKQSLTKRLIEYEPSTKDELYTLIAAKFYTIQYGLVNHDLKGSLTNSIQNLRLFNEESLYNSIDKEFVKNLFSNSEFSMHSCEYLCSLCYDENNWDFPLDISDVNRIRIDLFKLCVDQFPRDFKVLTQCFVLTADGRKQEDKIINNYLPEIIDAMRNHAEQHLSEFIPSIIRSVGKKTEDNKRNYFTINEMPIILWGSLESYYEYICSRQTDVSEVLINEFHEFFKEFQDNSYKSIPFTFRNITQLSAINISEIEDFVQKAQEKKNQNNYPIALDCIKKALERSLEIYGDKHIENTTLYDEIGKIQVMQGNYNEAAEYYDKSLVIYKCVFGDYSYKVAVYCTNLGHEFEENGDNNAKKTRNNSNIEQCYTLALKYYKIAYEVYEKNIESYKFEWAKFYVNKVEEKINKNRLSSTLRN